jgi:hypothetical protein
MFARLSLLFGEKKHFLSSISDIYNILSPHTIKKANQLGYAVCPVFQKKNLRCRVGWVEEEEKIAAAPG